jgi:hypothetical protein
MRRIVGLAVLALAALAQISHAQTGNSPFCLQTSAGAKCVYMTMGDCERARGNSSAAQCMTQADARGATGLGKPPGTRPSLPTAQEP